MYEYSRCGGRDNIYVDPWKRILPGESLHKIGKELMPEPWCIGPNTGGSFGDATVSPALLPTSGGRAIAGYSPRGRARAEGQGWWRHPSLPRPIALFRELSSARAAGDGNPRAGKAAVALPAVCRPHGAARGGRRMGAEHACRGAPAPLRHAAARGRWRHQALDPRSSECAPPALTSHHTDRRGAPGHCCALPQCVRGLFGLGGSPAGWPTSTSTVLEAAH